MAKKLICALGNPGKKYEKTRHNIGFRVLDAYLKQELLELKEAKKLHAYLAIQTTEKAHIICCYPQTFMNESGLAFKKVCNYFDISLENCLVLYDDVDLDFGQIRYRTKGTAGTHNGMRSIVRIANSLEIARLRIGIGKAPDYFNSLSDYVLANFNNSEEAKLPTILSASLKQIEQWVIK